MASAALLMGFLALASLHHFVSAQSAHHTICVADKTTPVQVNGYACKNITNVNADDFFLRGLDKSGKFNRYGSAVVPVTVGEIPGLNSVGVSAFRVDYLPGGIFPPHINHVSEILIVTEGSVETGFVTDYPDQRLISKVLQKGDVFVIPQGEIHYQKNVGSVNATVIVALSGQNVSPVLVANTAFGSNPKIPSDVLQKAFHVDATIIDKIESKFT